MQLCALRYPGLALLPGEIIAAEITYFLAAQLSLKDADLDDYAAREETRHEHMAACGRSTATNPCRAAVSGT